MWERFGRKRTGRIEHVQRPFGRLRTKREEEEGAYHGKAAVGLGIGILISIILISLSFWLLRRARETAPTTSLAEEVDEEGTPPMTEVVVVEENEEITPPVTEVVPDEMAEAAEYVPPREEPPLGEERPERRGAAPPTPPPPPREEPPPGEERPEGRTP